MSLHGVRRRPRPGVGAGPASAIRVPGAHVVFGSVRTHAPRAGARTRRRGHRRIDRVGGRHAPWVFPMKRPLGCAMLLAVGFGLPPAKARAQDQDAKRWAVGLEATWLGVPHGHLGYVPSIGTSAISGEVVARYRLLNALAIDAGFGLPHAAMGLSGWAA